MYIIKSKMHTTNCKLRVRTRIVRRRRGGAVLADWFPSRETVSTAFGGRWPSVLSHNSRTSEQQVQQYFTVSIHKWIIPIPIPICMNEFGGLWALDDWGLRPAPFWQHGAPGSLLRHVCSSIWLLDLKMPMPPIGCNAMMQWIGQQKNSRNKFIYDNSDNW